jgi:hypothetical protein
MKLPEHSCGKFDTVLISQTSYKLLFCTNITPYNRKEIFRKAALKMRVKLATAWQPSEASKPKEKAPGESKPPKYEDLFPETCV